jgi:hypothetical protein
MSAIAVSDLLDLDALRGELAIGRFILAKGKQWRVLIAHGGDLADFVAAI